MIRPLLSLERLSLDEREEKVWVISRPFILSFF
jgi:hypothetical protein